MRSQTPRRLLWALWIVIAIPAVTLSIWLTGELPLWPHFGGSSTPAGIAVWAVFVSLFYGTPLALFAVQKTGWRGRA
jgi:hypothetical protein